MSYKQDEQSASRVSRSADLDTDRHARFRLASIIESTDDAIVCKDLTGKITHWNRAATQMFGYEKDEMVGQSVLLLIPEELHGEEEEILRKLKAGEQIVHQETVRIRKSGERVQVSLTITPIKDDDNNIIGAVKIARNITEQKKADESRFRLAAIVESADDAIISKDLSSIVKSWNDSAMRTFGYTAAEMIGQSILKIIPKDLQYEEEAILRKLQDGQRIDHYETTRLKKNGDPTRSLCDNLSHQRRNGESNWCFKNCSGYLGSKTDRTAADSVGKIIGDWAVWLLRSHTR